MYIYGLFDLAKPTVIKYIGKTKNPINIRLIQHKSRARICLEKGTHTTNKLNKWMNSINRNIGIILIEECTQSIVSQREIYFITEFKKLNEIENTSNGGEMGPNLLGKNNGNSKKVLQYTLKGEFIKEYPSIIDASKETKVRASKISNCKNLSRVKSGGGYIWKNYEDGYSLKIRGYLRKKADNRGAKNILQYSIDGNFINTYQGRSQASAAVGCHRANILHALKSEYKYAFGYLWFYESEFSYELLHETMYKYKNKRKNQFV